MCKERYRIGYPKLNLVVWFVCFPFTFYLDLKLLCYHLKNTLRSQCKRNGDKKEYMKIGSILGRAIFQSSWVPYRRRFLFGWQFGSAGNRLVSQNVWRIEVPEDKNAKSGIKEQKITNIRRRIVRDQILPEMYFGSKKIYIHSRKESLSEASDGDVTKF